MLTRVRAQGGRRSRVPQHCRLQGPRPSQISVLGTHALPSRPGKPGSGSACPREAAHSARTRLQGASSKANFASAARSEAPRARLGRAGARCAQKAACSLIPGTRARPPAVPSLTSLRPPATRSGPAPGRLRAARQSAHKHMRATQRAARIHERAPVALPPSLARAPRHRRDRDRRGSARCRRIVSRQPYISSRALGSGTWGRAQRDKPLPLPTASWRSTGGDGGLHPNPSAALPLYSSPYTPPPQINCILGSAGQAAS